MVATSEPTEPRIDPYWGLCPTCLNTDGYINIGRVHWFVCHEHRARWCIGSNLSSTWMDQTEDDWARDCERIRAYAEIEPVHPGIPTRRRGSRELVIETASRFRRDVEAKPCAYCGGDASGWKPLGLRLVVGSVVPGGEVEPLCIVCARHFAEKDMFKLALSTA